MLGSDIYPFPEQWHHSGDAGMLLVIFAVLALACVVIVLLWLPGVGLLQLLHDWTSRLREKHPFLAGLLTVVGVLLFYVSPLIVFYIIYNIVIFFRA